jgi:gamma-glutamylcyclotransferase (GGCT)/AIG2-like uncharacterized protein YtfP
MDLASLLDEQGDAVLVCSGTMGMNLFTYGSLMFDEVWSQLVCGDYVKRSARLQGFTRRRVHGDVYPVIVRGRDGDWVDGVVYFGVDDADLKRLDLFEAEPYDRQTHLVVVDGCEKHPADAYVLKDDYRHMIHDCEWDPQWFEREALPIFIGSYRGFH